MKNKGKTIRYDFNLTDDDLNVGFEPDGSVVITIPLSEFQNQAANAVVYRTVDGIREPVPYDIRDGFLVIYADHFTPYNIDLVFPCELDGSHDRDEGSLTKPATCTEPGEMTYTCSVCSNTKTEPVPAAHSLSFVPEKAPSAEAEGTAAHYHCGVCGKNFADAEGREEMDSVSIPVQTDEPGTQQESNCVCGGRHEGAFSKLLIFIHTIIYFFRRLFNL